MAVGHAVRDHADTDVLLLRRDQLAAQRVLAGWQWSAAHPPEVLRPWEPRETLPDGVHDIWCRPPADQPWRIQLMLDESRGDDWISRNPCVRRPISALGEISADGIPYPAPGDPIVLQSESSATPATLHHDRCHTCWPYGG
jgi:hypothetical protein